MPTLLKDPTISSVLLHIARMDVQNGYVINAWLQVLVARHKLAD